MLLLLLLLGSIDDLHKDLHYCGMQALPAHFKNTLYKANTLTIELAEGLHSSSVSNVI
jgi:hypothetical protein